MHPHSAMSILHLAPATDHAMTETRWDEKRDDSPGRRATDGELVRAADSAISIRWRWAQMIAAIVGFGFAAGVFYVQSSATRTALSSIQVDIREFREEIKQFRGEQQRVAVTAAETAKDVAAQEKVIVELREQVRELRGQVDNIRNMREAYVWSASGAKGRREPPP